MPLLFLIYPFAELYAWYWFITNYSFGDAVLWCFLTAIVGIWILRLQGGAAAAQLQQAAQAGAMPPKKVIHHLLMGFGAFLLILPGLIIKVVGALCILPITRHIIVETLIWKAGAKLAQNVMRFGKMGPLGGFVFTSGMSRGWPQGPRAPERDARVAQDPNVIDVQGTVVEDTKLPPRDP